jgi:Bacterial SH3 domain
MNRIIFVLAMLAAASDLAYSAKKPVPVMFGGQEDLDACFASGVVKGLDAAGDNFLSVRSGPASDYPEIDRLYTNDSVTFCETNGKWVGIVYGEPKGKETGDVDGESPECGTGTPVQPQKPYDGPCRSGWVFKAYVEETAG